MMANVEDKRNFLRKAGDAVGQFFGDMDRKYADALYNEEMPDALQYGHANPIGEHIFRTGALDEAEKASGKTHVNDIFLHAGNAGIMGANIASRYALPLGGVTLAGKGLYDLTAGMNEQTSGTLMP